VILVAATTTSWLAPESIAETIIQQTTQTVKGDCQVSTGTEFSTTFLVSGLYIDTDPNGQIVDQGTYEYTRTGPAEGRINYHVSQAGTWQGGDYEELLHFATATKGTYEGRQTTGTCVYKGNFTLKK
jgi:hypothetical protein